MIHMNELPNTTSLHTTSLQGRRGTTAAPTKRDRVIYWACTGAVCAVMFFSAINFNLPNPIGPMKGAFTHLGLPNYFRIELTTAKALGVVAMLWPTAPLKLREFAYFGFGVTLLSASIAHFASGDSAMFVVDPLVFFGLLCVSYIYSDKVRTR
jgi:hypothetical protein